MAKNSKSQKIGRRGETAIWSIFEDLGFVCNEISNDFGEDFYVYGESDDVIEPFKIFVQVKASEAFDRNPSDWTEYCDPLTVRNWILSNELTIVVRKNFKSDEIRYSIPENECEYWDIDYKKGFPVRLNTSFDKRTAAELIWVARLRHYDRLMRLTLPNPFEKHEFEGVPRYRLFFLEFFVRIGIVDKPATIFSKAFLNLYMALFEETKSMLEAVEKPDMNVHEQNRFATCFTALPLMVAQVSGHALGLTPFFTDQAACALVQFVIDAEEKGLLPAC